MVAERKLQIESTAGEERESAKEAIDRYWLALARGEQVEHPGGEDHILQMATGGERRYSSVEASSGAP